MHSDELQNQLELKLGFQGTAYVVMKVPGKIKYATLLQPVQSVFQSFGTRMNCSHATRPKCKAN